MGQCMRRFWECKKKVRPYDCDGKLKCFEEKSKCYKDYKANKPNLPTKSPAKLACKTTFQGCLAEADDTCMSKMRCYMAKSQCYMRTKPWGHHRRPHHRRPKHRHHCKHHRRPHPNPEVMKCRMDWKRCVMKSRSCDDKLGCYWGTYKCMKARPKPSTTPPMPTTESDMNEREMYGRRHRRLDPKVIAKCEENFKDCINGTDDCRKKIGCFYGMKRCIHRPTPCPKVMKCKMEMRNCTAEAETCDDRLQCMSEMHECMEEARPTAPPQVDGPGYGRRRHWDPKHRTKCIEELNECLNKSSSCPEKMKCYGNMKKCMRPRSGPFQKMSPYQFKTAFKKITSPIHGHIFGRTESLEEIKARFPKMKQRVKQWGRRQGWRQNWQRKANEMRNRMQQWGQKVRNKFSQKRQGMRNRWNKWNRNP